MSSTGDTGTLSSTPDNSSNMDSERAPQADRN
jgi:hypothetical protein